MDSIKEFINFVARISFGELIVFPLFVTLFWGPDNMISVSVIWSLLISSFACALASVILAKLFFRGGREPSKRRIIVFYISNFVLMEAIVIASGLIFNWFDSDALPQIFAISGAVAAVYLLVSVLTTINDNKTAEKMNERLRSRRKERTDESTDSDPS
ncbi:MAG: DUF3021 family protein [Ruminiclostridium sp.]|nr:DUF3021 family protein [Ruminiclostridium sp.]